MSDFTAVTSYENSIAAEIFHPLPSLIVSTCSQELARYVEFVKAENQVLRARVPGQIHTKPDERSRLVKPGKVLGHAIDELITSIPSRPRQIVGRRAVHILGLGHPRACRDHWCRSTWLESWPRRMSNMLAPTLPVICRLSRPVCDDRNIGVDRQLQCGEFFGCTDGCCRSWPEDLQRLVCCWEQLPDFVRAAISQLCSTTPAVQPKGQQHAKSV